MDHYIPKINKIAEENGFKDFKLIFEKGSDLGFIGLLNKCRIIENDRELSLYCKFLPEDEERNSRYNSFLLFEREVLVYNEIFPIFEEFQLEHGIDRSDKEGFWTFPKSFYAHYDEDCPSKSIIIMEDLTTENFIVKDKFIPSDFNHTAKLFQELAKFHGLSLAINYKNPKALEKFRPLRNPMCITMRTELMKDIAPRNLSLITKLFQNENEQKIVEKLLPYKNDLWNQIAERLDKAGEESQSVICHGDVWINNILFNYCDTNKDIINEMKLVDWQITHYGSLGSELTYYLFICVNYEVRKNRQEELIMLYYNSMRQFLNKFSLDIEKVLPFKMLKDQLKTFGLYAFGMANFAIPLLCKYPEQLFENENAELTDEEMKCVENYNNVMRHLILDIIDMEIL
ncbi:uncharacterized protein [Chironomus tepperi]|uniref:uncharacterized protein n=1 Tax=Chironomus tepperi TaxID=113505 RepID=UPI00391F0BFE